MSHPPQRRQVDARTVERGHERDATSVRGVLAAVLALALLVGGALLALWYLRDDLAADVEPSSPRTARAAPAPDFSFARNWVRRADALGHQRDERRRLTSYGWVDREASVIHVPVSRAIELLLEEGLTVAPPPPEEPR